MTNSEIQAFLSVVQHGSISAAAEQLYVTQPALSRRIRNLEDELGYALFLRERGVREIRLTEQGEAFLAVAQKWNAVWREAMAIRGLVRKPVLHLAAIGSVGINILPGVLNRLAAPETPYNLDFHLCHSWEAHSLIEGGFADLALIDYLRGRDLTETGTVMSMPVYSTPFVLVGGPAWAGTASVHPAALDPTKEISLIWNIQFDLWHDHWFGSGTDPRAHLDSVSVLPPLLRDDLYAVVPRTAAEHMAKLRPDIAVCTLSDAPPDEIVHCLTSVDGRKKEPVVHFLRTLREELQSRPGVQCLLPET